jgi:hypothetical protein
METQSETLPERQGSTQNKVDLSQIAADHPVNQQTAVLDLNTFDASQLTLLEVLDMSEASGVDPAELGLILKSGNTGQKMRVFFSMAWCIARRANPFLTFAEVQTWKLEVIGETDVAKIERAQKRANAIVGAADVSGLHPDEAANLTVAQLSAYGARRKAANRAARRRKVG